MKKIDFQSVTFNEQKISLLDLKRLINLLSKLNISVTSYRSQEYGDQEQIEFKQIPETEKCTYLVTVNTRPDQEFNAALLAKPFKFENIQRGIINILSELLPSVSYNDFVWSLPSIRETVDRVAENIFQNI